MKLEYKELVLDRAYMERELNRLGNEGWELVTFIPVGSNVQCIFKRIKS